MLLNWASNRMNGPRFFPSGRRFGPYFCSRVAASAASSPFSLLVPSRLTTSAADIACHAAASPSVYAFVAALILHSVGCSPPYAKDSASGCRQGYADALRKVGLRRAVGRLCGVIYLRASPQLVERQRRVDPPRVVEIAVD